jgi:hypothetical protein
VTRQARKAQPTASPHTGKKPRRTPAGTVAVAAKIKADRPTITESELAAELGISASRWRRKVRREGRHYKAPPRHVTTSAAGRVDWHGADHPFGALCSEHQEESPRREP